MLINFAATKVSHNEVTVIDIRDYQMPTYSSDIEENEGFPDKAKAVRALFVQYDAFIIATPEHNGSMPAVFKNLIDWVSRLGDMNSPMFADVDGNKKPILLLSTSPGPTGGATNLANLANLMPWWGADVRGTYNLGSFYEHMTDNRLSADIDQELTELVQKFDLAL